MLAEKALIEKIWPVVWPLIESAVQLETADDILRDLLEQKRFLIIVGDGAAIFRPCDTFLEINYVGGKNAKAWWPEMSESFERAAKSLGINKIVAYGRDAWKKLAPDFTPTRTRMFIKEVV